MLYVLLYTCSLITLRFCQASCAEIITMARMSMLRTRVAKPLIQRVIRKYDAVISKLKTLRSCNLTQYASPTYG